jgi:hypothetical protein
MNREDLVSLCEGFAARRSGAFMGRLRVPDRSACDPARVDPVPEILQSFRRAEISENEKNALVSLVCDAEDEPDVISETACVRDPYADAQATPSDDDDSVAGLPGRAGFRPAG